jgi:hypothetical protein
VSVSPARDSPVYSTPPPDAVECSNTGVGRYVRAARGTDLTSCPFAQSVLAAANASSAVSGGQPGTVVAFSPVTKQNYDMACRVERVMTCRGGNNAVIYVY